MTSKELIAYLKGSWIHIAIIVFGLVSGMMLYGRFQSGDLSFGNRTRQQEVSAKQDKLAHLQKRLAAGLDQLAKQKKIEQTRQQLLDLQRDLKEQEAENAANAGKLVSLDEALAETAAMFDAYKQRYRKLVRDKAAGTKLESLTTLDGKTYQKVEIKSVGALGMNITHQEGSRRIPFQELPRNMQVQYQFDQEEAAAQKRREEDRRRRLELARQAALHAAQQDQPPENNEEKIRGQIEEMELAIDKLRSANRALDGRIKHASRRLREESAKKVNRSLQYKQELEELKAAEDINEGKIRELKDRIRRLRNSL